jgi:transcriptional regulator with XRE-family HTH domain
MSARTASETSREISATVATALKAAGITQRAAAARTGIPVSTLRRRLNGSSPFLVCELYELTELLGTSCSVIVARADARAAV